MVVLYKYNGWKRIVAPDRERLCDTPPCECRGGAGRTYLAHADNPKPGGDSNTCGSWFAYGENEGWDDDELVFEGWFNKGTYEVWNTKRAFGSQYMRWRIWGKTCFDVYAKDGLALVPNGQGCHTGIHRDNEEACVSARDGQPGKWFNSPCVWCCDRSCQSRFCRTLFQIERTAMHSSGPDPHSC